MKMDEVNIDSLQARFIWGGGGGRGGLYPLVFDQMVALCQRRLS